MLIFKYVFCLFQFTLKVIFLNMCFPWSRLFRDFKKFKIFLKVKWSLRTIEWRNLMTIFDICLTIPNIKPCKILSSQNRANDQLLHAVKTWFSCLQPNPTDVLRTSRILSPLYVCTRKNLHYIGRFLFSSPFSLIEPTEHTCNASKVLFV